MYPYVLPCSAIAGRCAHVPVSALDPVGVLKLNAALSNLVRTANIVGPEVCHPYPVQKQNVEALLPRDRFGAFSAPIVWEASRSHSTSSTRCVRSLFTYGSYRRVADGFNAPGTLSSSSRRSYAFSPSILLQIIDLEV